MRTERPAAPAARRPVGRTILVLLGGVVLPIVSIIVNASMQVVALGPVGVALVVASTLAVLANVVWMPLRRYRDGRPPEQGAPRPVWARVLLLAGALWAALWWIYLGLLFLPIVPLSFIALIVMGLGLCGLCPYLATSVAVIQSVRALRVLRTSLSRRGVALVAAAALAAPLLLAAALGLHGVLRDRALRRDLAAIARTAPYSLERMRAISRLEGHPRRLPALFMDSADLEGRRLIAEAYQRLTDHPIDAALHGRRRRGEIRPFWFLEARPVYSFRFFDPLRAL